MLTPYGTAEVARQVYQTSDGGPVYAPLDDRAGLVLGATPGFARMIAWKYAEMGSAKVQEDLARNHGRTVSRGWITRTAEAVACLAAELEQTSSPRLPKLEGTVREVVIALDEVTLGASGGEPLRAGVASLGLHGPSGERLYTIYRAAVLGPSVQPFLEEVGREIARVTNAWNPARYVGVTSARPWAVRFLRNRTEREYLDPHALWDRLEAAAVTCDEIARDDYAGWVTSLRPWLAGEEGGPDDLCLFRDQLLMSPSFRHHCPGVEELFEDLSKALCEPIPPSNLSDSAGGRRACGGSVGPGAGADRRPVREAQAAAGDQEHAGGAHAACLDPDRRPLGGVLATRRQSPGTLNVSTRPCHSPSAASGGAEGRRRDGQGAPDYHIANDRSGSSWPRSPAFPPARCRQPISVMIRTASFRSRSA